MTWRSSHRRGLSLHMLLTLFAYTRRDLEWELRLLTRDWA